MQNNSNTCESANQFEAFIGKSEVARRLGKTVRTVDAWMKDKGLPYYKLGRSVLFRWSDVEQHVIKTYRVAGRLAGEVGRANRRNRGKTQ